MMGCTCRLNSMHALATQTACPKSNLHYEEHALPLRFMTAGDARPPHPKQPGQDPACLLKGHVGKVFLSPSYMHSSPT